MRDNKRSIISFGFDILKLSLLGGLIYVILLVVVGYAMPFSIKKNINFRIGAFGHTYSRLAEVKNFGEVDVLFIGSSHAMRGFDNRIFAEKGISSLNLGTSSQSPIQSKLLLDRYLDRLSPEKVIIDVYPRGFAGDGLESTLDIISNDVADEAIYDMVVDLNHLKAWHTYLYKKISDMTGAYSGFSESVTKGEDTYISGGFVEKRIRYYKNDSPKTKLSWSMDDDQISAFEAIISDLRERGIAFKLVYTPITKGLYSQYDNTAEIDSIFSSYGDYYNFNEMMILDDSLDFYDSNHLNQNGVVKYNQKLIEKLFINN